MLFLVGKLEEACVNLSEKWFGRQVCSVPIDEDLEEFVLNNGSYGTTKAYIAVKLSKKSRIKLFIERIFMPYRLMCIRYPVCKNAPVLLPFMWILRWIQAISQKNKIKIKNEALAIAGTTNEASKKIDEMLRRLELEVRL